MKTEENCPSCGGPLRRKRLWVKGGVGRVEGRQCRECGYEEVPNIKKRDLEIKVVKESPRHDHIRY